MKEIIRDRFKNTLILCGNYNVETAEIDLQSGFANLIGFGRPFLNNPDFVERMKNNQPLSTTLDFNTFYTPGEKGYTDYPEFSGK